MLLLYTTELKHVVALTKPVLTLYKTYNKPMQAVTSSTTTLLPHWSMLSRQQQWSLAARPLLSMQATNSVNLLLLFEADTSPQTRRRAVAQSCSA